MKKTVSLLMFTVWASVAFAASATHVVTSPDGRVKMVFTLADRVSCTVLCDDQPLISDWQMELAGPNGALIPTDGFLKAFNYEADEIIHPVVPLKSSEIKSNYNGCTLLFRKGWIEARVYNEGVAYRFAVPPAGERIITDERFRLSLPAGSRFTLQLTSGFETAYQEPYKVVSGTDWKSDGRMATLPAYVALPDGKRLLVGETSVLDYPRMMLCSTGNGMRGAFPKVPSEYGDNGDRNQKILSEHPYIAHREPIGKQEEVARVQPPTASIRVSSGRNVQAEVFPWRYTVIARSDAELVESVLPAKLAPPCALDDTSWIVPGQVSWEWWNGASPYGPDVDFEAGFNEDTYKYFIDFASRYGIRYIIMDEGWALSTRDPYTPNPRIDVHELIRYGRERGVGIMLWLTWLTVENNFDLFRTFAQWGVSGVKIDFMDRSDQWMVNFYERVAAEAARNKLLVDFHGSFTPAGLEYRYPNVISYEAVRGMEEMGGCMPDNSLWFPFIRNVAGAMDYTPGAMLSMQPESYVSMRPNSASIGTRAYQMALFVAFESGVQMLADNPTLYYREPECTTFVTSVPVTWDQTRVLAAKAGEYLVVAKRKGDKWYIGGIANGTESERNFSFRADFLPREHDYTLTAFVDGPNAARQAMDFRRQISTINHNSTLEIRMVRNGGFAAVIE